MFTNNILFWLHQIKNIFAVPDCVMSKEEAGESYKKAIVNDQPSLLPKSDYINEYLIKVGT